MRKLTLVSAAAIALVAGASVTMFLPSPDAAAQAGGVYINAVDLVVIPSEMPKFLEAIKENGASAVKEPGCREFNITVLANNPNHVFLYESLRQCGRIGCASADGALQEVPSHDRQHDRGPQCSGNVTDRL